MKVGVIGPGRVGTGLARLLSDRGFAVIAVAGRTSAHAQALAGSLPDCKATTAQTVADSCDLVFITTPDDVIASVAGAVAWRRGQGVVHCSGALPAAVLASVARHGALPGAFHPLQTLPDARAAFENLPGSFIAIEAETPLKERLVAIADALGCTWGYVPPDARPAYHAAAVLVSNYTVALTHAGVDLWRALGKTDEEALQALAPLLQGAVNNLRRLGPATALTGPVARGDWPTVAKNLVAVADSAPQHTFTYAAMALAMIYNNLASTTGEAAPGTDAVAGKDSAVGKDIAGGKDAIERELRSLLETSLRNRGAL